MRPERPILFLSVLLLIHLVFFLVAHLGVPEQLPDSEEYLHAARNIWTRGILYSGEPGQPVREVLFTRRPPLYPLLLGITLPAPSGIPAFLLQILLSLLSAILVVRIFSGRHSPGKRFLPLLLIFILFTPAQFIYASRIMAEIPFQLILVAATWSVCRFSGTRENRYIWLFNLFLTLGMAVKPVLFPLVILTFPLSVFLFFNTRKAAFLTALILPLLWTGAYGYRNYLRTGSARYSSIQTANLVNYNLRYYIMSRQGNETAAETIDSLYAACRPEAGETRETLDGTEVTGRGKTGNRLNMKSMPESGYRQMDRCLNRGVREIINENPLDYALFHLKGSIRYFLDPGRFDMVSFFGISEPGSAGFLGALNQDGLRGAVRVLQQQGWWLVIILVVVALFKLLKLSGFILYLLNRREDLWLRLFLLLLVGYLALVTGPLGASRFLLPVELLIAGAAARGWILTAPISGRVHPGRAKG